MEDKKKNTFHSTEKGYIIRGQNAITKKKKKRSYISVFADGRSFWESAFSDWGPLA